MRLSTLSIDALTFSGKQRTVFDDQLPGFGVRVGTKTKTFVLMVGRERKLHSIGRYPAVSLKAARTAALRLLADRDSTKHAKPRTRVPEAIEAFLTEKKAQTRPETQRQYDRILNLYLKGIHHKYIEDVTTADITRVTDTHLKAGKSTSANRTLVVSKTFLKWCVKRRLISHSPAEGLDRPAREVQRERVLTDDELRAVWRAAGDCGEFGQIVRLLVLTGQRRQEIGLLKSEWIHGDRITWPAAAVKNNRIHSIPLGALAASLVQPFDWRGWTKAKARIDKKVMSLLNEKGDIPPRICQFTLHDLRRTYATNLQRLGIRLEIIEHLLNHQSGSTRGIVRVYQRYGFWSEMVEAVSKYEQWLQSTIISE